MAVADAHYFLRRGGALLLELGGDQADALRDDLARLGDVSGIEATLGEQP